MEQGASINLAHCERHLEKAKQVPLSIVIRSILDPGQTNSSRRDVQALCPLLIQHRWRALSLVGRNALDTFEPLFRHIIDNPQACKLSSLHLGAYWSLSPATPLLVRRLLAQTSTITDLAVPFELLAPTYGLFPRLRNFQGRYGSETEVLRILRETPQLQSLRLSSLYPISLRKDHMGVAMVSSSGPEALCRVEAVEYLDIDCSLHVPGSLLSQLDLPKIHTLRLSELRWGYQAADLWIESLMGNVLWLARIKSFTLERVRVSEKLLIRILQSLPVLKSLTLDSQEMVSCRITKALSQQPPAEQRWLCPYLEEVRFTLCTLLKEDDLKGLVEARVRGVPAVMPTGVTDPNLVSPVGLRKVVWNDRDMTEEVLGTG
ncbi:hypothetical protein FRB97_003420 [Tulasnella sp. 331]|nr:hypothetical protein FRB97_003420 [Tulasnella sp. 331]